MHQNENQTHYLIKVGKIHPKYAIITLHQSKIYDRFKLQILHLKGFYP